MPMKVEDAKKYEGYEEDEVKIVKFLTKNIRNAFKLDEIIQGIGESPLPLTPDKNGSYWTWQNTGNFVVNIANRIFVRNTLEEMVKKGKIEGREIAGEKYYFIEEDKGATVLF